MKQLIASFAVLFGIIAGLVYADSQWNDEPEIKIYVTPGAVVPVYITAVAEPDIPRDLWRCIQNPTLALDAPDVSLDYRVFAWSLEVTPQGDGQLNTYTVYNEAKNETAWINAVWGTQDGVLTLIKCEGVPESWGNYPPIGPSPTPYVLPAEAKDRGTPAS